MALRIGVIGTGMIGSEHLSRLATDISGAEVVAVYDLDGRRAAEVARSVGAVARPTAEAVVTDGDVDAVVIASPGDTHAELTLGCIHARKPVLCEKPLAPTTEECAKVVEAETAVGRRLVQVGFMRRYDPGYLQVKAALDAGRVGVPLLLHCVHRNPSVPPTFTSEMAMNDTVIHEIDSTRWLLGEEIVAVRVLAGRRTPHAASQLADPQIVIFETTSGAIAEVEVFVNCRFGYDVRCEVVGSEGTVTVETPRLGSLTSAGFRSEAIPESWSDRFGETYRQELRAWVDAAAAGAGVGPSSWDGYAATAVAERAVEAQRTGDRVAVHLIERPDLYA